MCNDWFWKLQLFITSKQCHCARYELFAFSASPAVKCIPMSRNKGRKRRIVRNLYAWAQPGSNLHCSTRKVERIQWSYDKVPYARHVNEILNDNRHLWLRYFASQLYGITYKRLIVRFEGRNMTSCARLVAIVWKTYKAFQERNMTGCARLVATVWKTDTKVRACKHSSWSIYGQWAMSVSTLTGNIIKQISRTLTNFDYLTVALVWKKKNV